jgi:hypothetical protein
LAIAIGVAIAQRKPKVLLHVPREQCPDGIVNDGATCHPQARSERVTQQTRFESGEQRCTDLPFVPPLQLVVL